jgi:hypothetical protein
MKPVMNDRWNIMLARLQTRWQLQSCGLIDKAHELHVSINRRNGHVIFEVSCETREAGMLISGNRHGIEAIRSSPQAASCAERLRPSIDMVTAHRKDG